MRQIEQKVCDLAYDVSPCTLAEVISAQAAQIPEQAAILAPNRRWLTYKQLHTQIHSVVRELNSIGVGRNDRVAIVLPNGPELAVTVLAVSAAATSAPLNPSYRAAEFDFFLSDVGAKALIVREGMDSPARAIAQARQIPVIELSPELKREAGLFTLNSVSTLTAGCAELARPDDVALVLHTSGTTSRAKLVNLTHANLWTSTFNIRMTLALSRHDRCLNVMPLFHVHGLVGALFSSLSAGASVVCTPGFDATQFFHCLEVFHPTWYTAVPTMHQAILAQAQRNAEVIHHYPLRFIRSCSAPLPSPVMAELEDLFKAPVIESYGMTEATHQIASNPLPPNERKIGSVGLPTGTEVAVIDDDRRLLAPGEVGEIIIRGETVIDSYANNGKAKEESFANGWFKTGDLGYLDSDGYLYLTGRLKDIINRGGEKISPYEVESALSDHAAIAEAVVFPLVHRTLGEDIAAAVVLKDDASVTDVELQQFVLGKVAEFKVPRRIEIVELIPKGPTGKLQRSRLAEQISLGVSGSRKSETRADFVEPQTALEVELVKIWEEVLRVKQLGIHDNFFDLGGNSLLATQIISKVFTMLQVELPVRMFFEAPTVAGLAKLIETIRWTGQHQQLPIENKEKREQGDL